MDTQNDIVKGTASKKVRYRLYIDESGDHAYKLLDRPDHQYLALLGVWFRQNDDYVTFTDAFEEFKRTIFGPRPDNPVVLHRSDVINRRGPFGIFVNHEKRTEFDRGLVGLVEQARFKLICVVIDKQEHLKKYQSPFHPYHYCLAALLDRYSGYLNYKNAVGDVMAESRGKEEDSQLKGAYCRVYENGTLMFPRSHHQRVLTTKKIKIRTKVANIAGLQLADILAHPVKQAMLREKNWISGDVGPFGKHLLHAARHKFNCNELTERVKGYGKVWL